MTTETRRRVNYTTTHNRLPEGFALTSAQGRHSVADAVAAAIGRKLGMVALDPVPDGETEYADRYQLTLGWFKADHFNAVSQINFSVQRGQ
jgi:hypothetical protein